MSISILIMVHWSIFSPQQNSEEKFGATKEKYNLVFFFLKMAEEGELDYEVLDGIKGRFKYLLTPKVRIKQNHLNILRAYQGSFIHLKKIML